MTTMEHPASAEQTAVRDFLAERQGQFQAFQIFYDTYCHPNTPPPERIDPDGNVICYEEILARGDTGGGQIFVARQAPGDSSQQRNYLIMRFDVTSGQTYEHPVIFADHHGINEQRERMQYSSHYECALSTGQFSLYLSSCGSYITSNDDPDDKEYLGDVLLLPYQVDHLRQKRQATLSAEVIQLVTQPALEEAA